MSCYMCRCMTRNSFNLSEGAHTFFISHQPNFNQHYKLSNLLRNLIEIIKLIHWINKMQSHKTLIAISISVLLTWLGLFNWALAEVDCTTVTTLVSSCSSFIEHGFPDPMPSSPCCEGVNSLNVIADTTENKQSVCSCLMDLISTYNTNATAIATLPGFCGVALGFVIDPNTDCS